MLRIDQMTKAEKQALQRLMIGEGYLAPENARGRRNDDGIWGTVSAAAYEAYMREANDALLVAPAPAKPWWQSRRGKGLIKMALGLVLGIAGRFWEPAANVDSALLLDTIFASLPSIIEALGLGVASWGATQSAVGAAQAQAPLTLRAPRPAPARRMPGASLPPGDSRPARLRQADVDEARGHFGDAP
jgi:hypothetical protein